MRLIGLAFPTKFSDSYSRIIFVEIFIRISDSSNSGLPNSSEVSLKGMTLFLKMF